jgi:hypothetical protein
MYVGRERLSKEIFEYRTRDVKIRKYCENENVCSVTGNYFVRHAVMPDHDASFQIVIIRPDYSCLSYLLIALLTLAAVLLCIRHRTSEWQQLTADDGR